MEAALETAQSNASTSLSQQFVKRWKEGKRTCFRAEAGELPTVPYPGLRSFREDISAYFFGREVQKGDLKEVFAGWAKEEINKPKQVTFVVGGSASGKSSLVRAGLIAELDTIRHKDSWGAWYVAAMRPSTDPIARIQEALWNAFRPLLARGFPDKEKPDRPDYDLRNRASRLRFAAKGRFAWSETSTLTEVEQEARRWLHGELSPRDGILSTFGVFDYVEKTLRDFDSAASSESRGLKPLLLLFIDQFEEIFRDSCKADGRTQVIKLLRDIHQYQPESLFAVCTMRSEELHRFSEFTGMAEVINSSMYLVDLVATSEIEEAIVQPARRLAWSWELPIKSTRLAPFSEEAVEDLMRAYRDAGSVAEHKADMLPLLQHLLPIVWGYAVEDWIKRRNSDRNAHFEIRRTHLETLPGWEPTAHETDSPVLGRCLNAAADSVFTKALSEELEPQLVHAENFLWVALCSLAQLDDAGQAVRKFASLEEMLEASAVKASAEIRQQLKKALKHFEDAGFIEAISAHEGGDIKYNVVHESLIRNWIKFRDRLELQLHLEHRLLQLAEQIPTSPAVTSWLDRVLRKDWEAAAMLIPVETQDLLQLLFGSRACYSEGWGIDAISKSKRPSITQANKASLEVRWQAIKNTWHKSLRWTEVGKKRYRRIQNQAILATAAVLSLLYIAGVSIVLLNSSRNRADEFAQLLKLSAAVNETATPATKDGYRSAVEDRALAWLIGALREYDGTTTDAEQKAVVQRSIGNIDRGIRALLENDLVVQFTSTPPPGNLEKAICSKSLKGPKGLSAKDGVVKQLAFDPLQLGESNVVMSADDGLLCASKNGEWAVQLGVNAQSPTNTSVNLFRLNLPIKPPPRYPAAAENVLRMGQLVGEGYSTRLLQLDIDAVSFFRTAMMVGFMIPDLGPSMDGRRSAVLLWTTTGVSDPVSGEITVDRSPPACSNYSISQLSQNENTKACVLSESYFENSVKRLTIYRPIYSRSTVCKDDLSATCNNTIELKYVNENGKDYTRASISHFGPKIIDAGISGDWIWLDDVYLRRWSYIIGTEPLKAILAQRWRNITWRGPGNPFGIDYRIPSSCEDIKGCKESIEKADSQWIGAPQ
ncbi:hypothetical protein [Sinorhizobium meliloti]|uniref:nSTAND1 domain-containing NTPase n=1 Tax=Rhizobium meliloti TaxID=382 RepID=UPI003D662094